MTLPRIREVRARVARGGGADYHDQGSDHWIDDHIATPMAKYPEYRQSRQSFGSNVLGSLVVEVEAEDGTVGFAVTTAGEPGAWIVEKHLSRFVEGAHATEIEKIWDQMYLSTLYYGRKGLVLNAISAVDLALWISLASSGTSRWMRCSVARSATNSPAMRPALARTWLSGWVSSAARCRCGTVRPKGRPGCAPTSTDFARCGSGSAGTSG